MLAFVPMRQFCMIDGRTDVMGKKNMVLTSEKRIEVEHVRYFTQFHQLQLQP